MDIFLQQIINGLTAGSVYALVALGYTMVYGIIGLINFAHGDVVMVGAMIATSVVLALVGHYGDVSVFVAVGAALVVSIPVCMALGWTADWLADPTTGQRPLTVEGVQGDLRTGGGETVCQGLTQAASGTGNEDALRRLHGQLLRV